MVEKKKTRTLTTPVLNREKTIEMYRRMLLIRYFDQQARDLFMRNLIRGTTHTYTGQEAVAVGTCANLRESDYITSTHRGHGHCLAKGGDPKRMMAELLGRETGYCKGKGGSMHIADVDLGILGANGIVGGGIGIATGAAYSIRLQGRDDVAVCFFGDGAMNQGVFFESINMAALWKLPVIYLCEENQYSEFSQAYRLRPVAELALRAVPFGVPAITVDGNDIMDVYRGSGEAVSRARSGEGPSLIVAQTYRLEGHTVGDPLTYRPAGESDTWWKKDPIPRFARYLVEQKFATSEDLTELEEEASRIITEAVQFAQESPAPEMSELWKDVYVEMRP